VLEAQKEQRRRSNRLKDYRPYAKQREFHVAGAKYRIRGMLAANQVGKTLSAGAEVAMHLTGIYPEWWDGLRFNRPVRWLAGSESAELTRKGIQRILLGPPEIESEWGTGMIPKASFMGHARRPGVPDALATIQVRHISGGISVIQLASYDQGRTKWQADTVDGVWFDEEPPQEIFSEGITRTNVTLGPILLTMTPLLGMSDVVRRLLLEKPPGTFVVSMTIDDAEHYSPEQRQAIVDSYPEHEREARTKGIPTLGSGRIFPLAEGTIRFETFAFPSHWPRIAGMDFGWDHPTACVWMIWDRDSDVVYVYDAYRVRQEAVAIHAAAIKGRGAWIPVAWPHDGENDTAAGKNLSQQYRDAGLNMLHTRAQFQDGSNSVEAGLMMMLDRMRKGQLKVAAHLADWWEEFRLYHRKDGKVVKEGDDLMSATRYGLMMLAHATLKKDEWNKPLKINRKYVV
jgi:phage terminase large subunit-like protein